MNRNVTIVVPCFNAPKRYLASTLKSIRKSTLRPAETCVINDGSTDPDLLAYLDIIRENTENTVVIDLYPQKGLAAARNAGFELAKTEFVIPLDSDDLIAPKFIERTYKALRRNPNAGFAYTWVKTFSQNKYTWPCPRWNLAHLLQSNICNPTALIRREAWEMVGGYGKLRYQGLEDWDLWLKFAQVGLYGVLVPETLFYYRLRAGSMLDELVSTGKFWEAREELILRHQDLYAKYLPEVLRSSAQRNYQLATTANSLRSHLSSRWRDLRNGISTRGMNYVSRIPSFPPLLRSRKRIVFAMPNSRTISNPSMDISSKDFSDRGLEVEIINTGKQEGFISNHQSGIFPRHPTSDIAKLILNRPRVVISSVVDPVQHLIQASGLPWILYLQDCCAWLPLDRLNEFRQKLQKADAIWTVSSTSADYLSAIFNVDRERLHSIHLPIHEYPHHPDGGTRKRSRKEFGIPPDKPVLLFIGHTSREAGLPHLIQALWHARQQGFEIYLLIVADNDVSPLVYLQREISNLEMENRVFVVSSESSDDNWAEVADMGIFPSLIAANNPHAVRALVHGVPCIMTRVGDAVELSEQTEAVYLIDPPQGMQVGIHPENYNWCMTYDFPGYAESLCGEIMHAIERLDKLKYKARNSRDILLSTRSPQMFIDQVLHALHNMGV
jgi:glycosyltransferase involved in cell wall biosynthesis